MAEKAKGIERKGQAAAGQLAPIPLCRGGCGASPLIASSDQSRASSFPFDSMAVAILAAAMPEQPADVKSASGACGYGPMSGVLDPAMDRGGIEESRPRR